MACNVNIKDNFTIIPNALLGIELSDRAFKLAVYMYSTPKDWEYHNGVICKLLNTSEKSLAKSWKELLDQNIVTRTRRVVNGVPNGGYDYIVHDVSPKSSDLPDRPKGVSPKSSETINNTNLITKTDYTMATQKTNYDKLLDDWNDIAKTLGLQTMLKITKPRQDKLKARLKDDSKFLDNLNQVIEVISETPFLTGRNKNNWKVDFDWLIANSNNYVKILEGKYS